MSIFIRSLLLTCAVVMLDQASLIGQQAPTSEHSAHPQQMQIVVDGKTTPDLIPDDLAYHHFLITIAEHAQPSQEEVRRRRSRIVRIELPEQDADALVKATAGLREQMDEVETARAAGGDSRALRDRVESAMVGVRAKIRSTLSPEGLKIFDGFIKTQVKGSIKIYGSK